MIFNKNKMGSLITGFTNQRNTFGRFIHKLKISTPMTAPPKRKSCYSEKQNIFGIFFFFTKNDKDEFNTISKTPNKTSQKL